MKWDQAIIQAGNDTCSFVCNVLSDPSRRCILICGAGFDPRTLVLLEQLPESLRKRISTLCLRENRPRIQSKLIRIADEHARRFSEALGDCRVVPFDIFDEGNGVVGGRRVIPIVDEFVDSAQAKEAVTDVLVDISALSCGIFFPIIAQLLARIENEGQSWNLHLFVAENPQIDSKIRGEIADTVSHIHGFRSSESLPQTNDHASLWVPVLAENNEAEMRLIHGLISQPALTVDISPIIPFPGLDPRRPDILVEHYREIIGEWEVDLRHLLYAAESDPLDSYRSICEIDELRRDTYGSLGGSSTIVSPLGNKMLSVGLMLAAIERRLRAVYVECRGYEERDVPVADSSGQATRPITHLWLEGEIYRR